MSIRKGHRPGAIGLGQTRHAGVRYHAATEYRYAGSICKSSRMLARRGLDDSEREERGVCPSPCRLRGHEEVINLPFTSSNVANCNYHDKVASTQSAWRQSR